MNAVLADKECISEISLSYRFSIDFVLLAESLAFALVSFPCFMVFLFSFHCRSIGPHDPVLHL